MLTSPFSVQMFKFNIEDEAKHFLNLNVKVLSETSIKLTMEAYLLKMADETVPDWRSWPMLDVPGTEMLQKDYDAAHALRQSGQSSTAAQVASFRTKVGKLMYTHARRACRCSVLHQSPVACSDVCNFSSREAC